MKLTTLLYTLILILTPTLYPSTSPHTFRANTHSPALLVTALPVIGHLFGATWQGAFTFLPDFVQFVFADFFVAIAKPLTSPVGSAIDNRIQDFGRAVERRGKNWAQELRVSAKEHFGTRKGERLEEWSAVVDVQSRRAATTILSLGQLGSSTWTVIQVAFWRSGIKSFVGQFPMQWFSNLKYAFVPT